MSRRPAKTNMPSNKFYANTTNYSGSGYYNPPPMDFDWKWFEPRKTADDTYVTDVTVTYGPSGTFTSDPWPYEPQQAVKYVEAEYEPLTPLVRVPAVTEPVFGQAVYWTCLVCKRPAVALVFTIYTLTTEVFSTRGDCLIEPLCEDCIKSRKFDNFSILAPLGDYKIPEAENQPVPVASAIGMRAIKLDE